MKLTHQLFGGFEGTFVDTFLTGITSVERVAMAERMFQWLSTETRLKPLPELPQLLEGMHKRIQQMANSAQFKFENGEVVFIVNGSSESTYRDLKNGTTWFDPCSNVVNVLISALWKS